MLVEQKTEILENSISRKYRIVIDTQIKNRSKKNELRIYKAQEIICRLADVKNLYLKKKKAQETIRGLAHNPLKSGVYEHQKGGVWFLKSNPSKKYLGFFPEKYLETFYYRFDCGENEKMSFCDVLQFHEQLADIRSLQCFNPSQEGWTPCKSYVVAIGGWFIQGKKYFQKIAENLIVEQDKIPKELLDILRQEPATPRKVEVQIRYVNIENVVAFSPA